MELLAHRLRDQVESSGREGNATALAVQDDIAKLHEAAEALKPQPGEPAKHVMLLVPHFGKPWVIWGWQNHETHNFNF